MNLHKNCPYGGKCGVKSSPCGSSFKGFLEWFWNSTFAGNIR